MATPVGNSIPVTGNVFIDGLIQGGSWQFAGPRTLTYSLNVNDTPGPYGGVWSSYPALAGVVAQAATAWSNVANIQFQQIVSGNVFLQSQADIAVTLTGDELFPVVGLGVPPDPAFANSIFEASGYTRAIYPRPEGDMFLANFYSGFSHTGPGGFALALVLHEMGHALGLKHPVDDGGSGRPTFAELGVSAYDHGLWTVMSSNSPSVGTSVSAGNQVTPMPLDIAAIQAIYGANMAYRAGDDVYTLSGATFIDTIWDASGIDTIDASHLNLGAITIDLAPGSFVLHGFNSITAIAFGVTIEHAIGTTSADVLVGNSAANNLTALDGNDRLDGGVGADTLNGGGGDDVYVVGDTGDAIIDASGVDTVQSYIPWVLGTGLENLTLLGSAAYGVGNDLNNSIVGNAANNPLLRGGGGSDTITGGAGNDWLEGETGNDAFAGVAGNDNLQGEAGDDTVLAGAGDDLVYGGSGTDFLIGETGNDLMYGGSEWDAIDGRQGSDVLYGDGGADIIFGDGYFYLFGFSNDSLFGGDDNDIMMGEAGESSTDGAGDAIHGEAGNDLLDGGAGNDAVYGGDGNDVIDGDHGNDYIVGGSGAETMLGSNAVNFGGATNGSDLFAYLSMADAGDFIYGFDTRAGDTDGIDLRALFDSLGYAGTTPRAAGTNLLQVVDSGGNALVQIDPDGAPGPQGFSTLVTLVGVNAGAVTDGFFLFQ